MPEIVVQTTEPAAALSGRSRHRDRARRSRYHRTQGRVCGDHGAERLRQIDAAESARRAGPAHGGQCALGGRDLHGLSEDTIAALRRKTIGFIFQRHDLFPVLTARENVEFPLLLDGLPPAERRARARNSWRWLAWPTKPTSARRALGRAAAARWALPARS